MNGGTVGHPTSGLHVAHFVQRYPPAVGGSEAYFARLTDHLTACGDAVTVVTSTAVGLAEMWEGSRRPAEIVGPVRRFAPLTFPGRRYVLKAASLLPVRRWQCLTAPCNPVCPAMWRAAGRFDGPLDAVHATAFPYSFPVACGLRLARRHGVPFFLTPFLHTGDPDDPNDRTRRQYTRPHLRWLLRQADRVFVQTHLERDTAVSIGAPPERVVVQGLGVDPAECTGGDRAAARAAWGVDDEVVVGHLANASVEKGTVDLLSAAARLWDAGKAFRVVLAGPEMPNFLAFWERFPHRNRVRTLGPITDAQKRDFFAGIDAFALPSRSDSFGLVLLEAWANAKPNLVYRAGGPAELVRDGIDGLQARCGAIAGLADQLGRLVGDERLREWLGTVGRERVGAEFRWADKLALVRHEMLAGRRKPAGRSG
ncbi:glycosyltransferase family 4 protein [bacterium]|nr:glycosyltransferase family 4 protein [bacterium]